MIVVVFVSMFAIKFTCLQTKLSMNNTSSNPSDYQFLLRTLSEGNAIAKSESLKRLNTLVLTDKKQFAAYSKRIVVALQDLILQQAQDVNLLAATLTLEIINLNPRDIEYYLKSKLLRPLLANLGDPKPQLRKTSHYCLLGYVRTFKNFDDLMEVYLQQGLQSHQWQLRQKSINSLQSIIVMEIRYMNWESKIFKQTFEALLMRLKDQNGFVQKAAEQCLLSLSKVQQLRNFAKKLNSNLFNQLKTFCEEQYEQGHLNEVKLQLGTKKDKVQSQRYMQNNSKMRSNGHTVSLNNTQIIDKYRAQGRLDARATPLKIFNEQQPTRRARQDKSPDKYSLRKAQSAMKVSQHKQLQHSVNLKQARNPQSNHKNITRQSSVLLPPISLQRNGPNRHQKLQNIMGKKVLQDIKNDKDWKARLQAIQQLQAKFQLNKTQLQKDVILKTFLPMLIKLLTDANFKVALTALKLIQDIIHIPNMNISSVIPQIIQKLNDNKVALRQNISKLIKKQYQISQDSIWIDNLLGLVKKTVNSNIKEQILNILIKLYDETNMTYPMEKVIQIICPMMDDLKTKIKIKTLDLLTMITVKSQKIDKCKTLLSTKLNQVYYQMYLQKISKQLKNLHPNSQSPKKMHKIGNTTSTSLRKQSHKEHTQTVKTAFYQPNQPNMSRVETDNQTQEKTIPSQNLKTHQVEQLDTSAIMNQKQIISNKNVQPRYLRRRGNKSIQARMSTTNYSNYGDNFPPFRDPQKQLKLILVQLKSQDWQVSNQALNKLRRIIIHHCDLLTPNLTRTLIPDVMKLTQSLRSTLSKNAVTVVNEMYSSLKKQLDVDLQLIFSKLIKKTLDTNSFISQQVKKALLSVCSHAHQGKVVTLLHNTHISRAIPIKTSIITILQGITFLPKVYDKQLDRIVTILIDFMSQGSLQIRDRSKSVLNSIILSQKGQSIMRLIPKEIRGKLKKRQESTISPSKIQIPAQPSLSLKQTLPPSGQSQMFPRRKKQKINTFPQQFQKIQAYLQNCQSSDWRTRLDNMTLIAQLCGQYPQQIMQYRSSSRIMDVLSKQINDPNSKVSANALTVFIQLVPKLSQLVQTSLSMIINQVFICFSTMKSQIKQLAQQLFQAICGRVQKWMLTQHICNGAIYSIQKSKPTILSKLNKLMPVICRVKPNIFQKNVYPMVNKLAQQNKPELLPSLKELLQTIYTELGEDCMSYLKQKAKNILFE